MVVPLALEPGEQVGRRQRQDHLACPAEGAAGEPRAQVQMEVAELTVILAAVAAGEVHPGLHLSAVQAATRFGAGAVALDRERFRHPLEEVPRSVARAAHRV